MTEFCAYIPIMPQCIRGTVFPILVFSLLLSCTEHVGSESRSRIIPPELEAYPSQKPKRPVDLIFIHHSCGGHLLAERGESQEKYIGSRIYDKHPNGGGLRNALRENNYIVHEASYKSMIGEDTDICHWNRKFSNHMNKILTCKGQDDFFKDGTVNRVVVFKSCFPNSWIESEGEGPGNPDACERTVVNYKASFLALLSSFKTRPETLFVVFTSPPLAKPNNGIKTKALTAVKRFFGSPDPLDETGRRIRDFNNWLKDPDNGWLKDYNLKNVVVFDYFDILTGYGVSDWSAYPTRNGKDSHPSSEGNESAAREFIPFLNKAVNRMEIGTAL